MLLMDNAHIKCLKASIVYLCIYCYFFPIYILPKQLFCCIMVFIDMHIMILITNVSSKGLNDHGTTKRHTHTLETTPALSLLSK